MKDTIGFQEDRTFLSINDKDFTLLDLYEIEGQFLQRCTQSVADSREHFYFRKDEGGGGKSRKVIC